MKRFRVTFHSKEKKGYFNFLAQTKSPKYDHEIEKDLERTFPDNPSFSKGKPSYTKLFKILRAISVHSPELGYVQGFNFLAGHLLKFIQDEE